MDRQTENARNLRKNMTEAEKRLWSCLRGEQLRAKFRRQAPIGPYIADFVAFEQNLIVELDGGQHADPDQEEHDRRRTEFLKHQGFKVLRFWNNEALNNTEGMLAVIAEELAKASNQRPSAAE